MATLLSSCHLFLAQDNGKSFRLTSRTRSIRLTSRTRSISRSNSRCRRRTLTPRAVQTTETVTSEPAVVTLSNQKQRLDGQQFKLRGEVTLSKKSLLDLSDVFSDLIDDIADIFGKKVRLQLVSEEVDPATGKARVTEEVPIPNWIWSKDGLLPRDARYELEFTVDSSFGKPGAILIKNEHPTEFLLKELSLEDPDGTKLFFRCNSWVYPPSATVPRVFFRDKMCLPKRTPAGMKELRRQELKVIRGDGLGRRVTSDRIYDYDIYNDIGNVDENDEFKRPILGGTQFPYPRRVRTGRPRAKKDPQYESWPQGVLEDMYVPVDEEFRRTKTSNFLGDAIKAAAHQLVPAIKDRLYRRGDTYKSFREIRGLYDRGVDLGKVVVPATEEINQNKVKSPFTLINQLTVADQTNDSLLKYPLPQVIKTHFNAWMSDDEFARQTLAGLNPLVITKLDSFPPKSSLDPQVYGEGSALTKDHIEPQLEGFTVEEALEKNKLFAVDYHDVFLPYLDKINAVEGRKLHAARAIFYLTKGGTLKTVALELSLPPAGGRGQRQNRVFVPPRTTDEKWVWELAKAHFSVNDCGFHQLVSHWLRTHACIEPFIISTNRQLSSIHPIHCLLKPHFKNTMSINGKARKSLINASGIIEDNFTPGEHSIPLSSVAYDLLWRFDHQGVPGDLISRGIAIPNTEAKHGLELTIPDYPYAVDALDVWVAIKAWVKDYTNIFYESDSAVRADEELQMWWGEVVNVGHGDKRHQDWWPKMSSKGSLVEVATTIIWLASGHHAAVNFGQYAYAGFPPNKPTITHKLVPEPGTPEYETMLKNGEEYLLSAISNKSEATTILTTIEILSTHSEDEEYLGGPRCNWTSNESVLAAYEKFSAAIREVEKAIIERNKDLSLSNRRGPVEVDYTLLVPSSPPGITGRGVPNSVSI